MSKDFGGDFITIADEEGNEFELELLDMLDLGHVPVRAADRGEKDPLVIAGGPCACNPEPLAPFFDAFVIGDGE